MSLKEMCDIVESHLPKGLYTIDRIKKEFGVENPWDVVKEVPHLDKVQS
jgi:hypothetical protein